jgi:hypothetical protein
MPIVSICWPHCRHASNIEVKATSFAVAQYAFVCVFHDREHIQLVHHQMLQPMVMMITSDRGILQIV